MVGDVSEATEDGTLEHEAAKASGMVAMVDGGLHGVGDRIHHRIHGRYGVYHLLPWVEMQRRRRSLGELPLLFASAVWSVRADNVLEEKVSMDENDCPY